MSTDTADLVEISISTDPWELVDVDAFVCPINSEGDPSPYPARRIRELSGVDIAGRIQGHTPLAVGAALVAEGGRMRARNLILVPNTETAGGKVQVEDVLRATAATLVACEARGFDSVAMPLMGAFDNGIPAEEAARAIHSEFRAYRAKRPLRVLLMARDIDEVEVFELAIETSA